MLSAAILKEALRLALIEETGAADCEATTKLAEVIAREVVAHITACAVVTIPVGVPVATAGSPSAQVGATTAPAIGTIS